MSIHLSYPSEGPEPRTERAAKATSSGLADARLKGVSTGSILPRAFKSDVIESDVIEPVLAFYRGVA